MGSVDILFKEYTDVRFLDINKEQFVYLLHLLPPCLVAMSDGIIDKEEWTTLKSLSKIPGNELATEDLGAIEKGENLMLIYKDEIRYLLKNKKKWQSKFFSALQEYFDQNEASKYFLAETLELFRKDDQASPQELDTLNFIKTELGI
ncbi:MAG: hypothetical protein AAFX57_02320 [Bacteroidota bacterium]